MHHRGEEKTTGAESWPATPQHKLTLDNSEEVDFCRELDCLAKESSKELEW
jgi:hypothetical protein